MKTAQEAYWLAGQAFNGLTYIWQVSIVLLAAFLACVAYDIKQHKLTINIKLLYLPLPLLGSVVILLSGATFRGTQQYEILTLIGFAISIGLSATSIAVLRKAWRTAAAVGVLSCWYSFWCSFVAAMSISGDWL